MKGLMTLLFLPVCCMALVACGSNDEEMSAEPSSAQSSQALPGAVADLPFPNGADLDVTTSDASGVRQHVVSFSFSESAASVYEDFRSYATNNGYSLATEDQENYRFSSVGDAPEALVVDISEMGSVNVGTATVQVAAER